MGADEWINPQMNELNSPGDVIEGILLSIDKKTKYRTNGTNGEEYEEVIYRFIDSDGDEFSIRGTSGINKQMTKVPQGATVRIEYKEDKPTDKGNPFKVFKVQYRLPSGELTKTKAQAKRETKDEFNQGPPPDGAPF